MNRTTICRSLGAILLSAPLFAAAAPITTFFNTGVDNTGATLANNAAETHYTLAASSVAVLSLRAATSVNGFPIPPWLGDDTASDWIGPTDSQLNGPSGTYDYRTTFVLGDVNPATASISGLWSADDAGLDILINGVSTGQVTTSNFQAFSPFSITSGFVSGLNTIDFIISNGGGPTGLRVEATGTVPEPGSVTLLAAGLLGLALRRRIAAKR